MMKRDLAFDHEDIYRKLEIIPGFHLCISEINFKHQLRFFFSLKVKLMLLLLQFPDSHPLKLKYLATNSIYQCLVRAWALVRNTMHYLRLEQEYLIQANIIILLKLTPKKKHNHAIPNKGSQVINSPASTFEGSRNREIHMVNNYN